MSPQTTPHMVRGWLREGDAARVAILPGEEITGEFLMSTGYLPIQHDPGCFRHSIREPFPGR